MASRRICIIGDSHAAALKHGWDAIRSEHAAFELTFFAAPNPLPQYIAVEGRTLIATDSKLREVFKQVSGGKTEISADYEAYLICGLGLNIFGARHVYNRCRAPHHAVRPDLPLVSSSVFRTAVTDHLSTSIAHRTLQAVRQISAAPTFLIANPFPTRARHNEFWSALEKDGDAGDLLAVFHSSSRDIARAAEACFLQQPEETLADGLATRDAFGQNAERLFPGQPDDYLHMNDIYGAMVLREALERIGAS